MRIRTVFWCMLAVVCCSLLIFSAAVREHAPAVMQVRLDKAAPVSPSSLTVEMHLSDPQNIPIEQAHILPDAEMTNMAMNAISSTVKTQGQGNYLIQFALAMAGPWKIHILANADGFDPIQQSMFVQVPSSVTMCEGVHVT